MGYVKRNIQKEPVGEIRFLDSTPIWIGSKDNSPRVERFMRADAAEEWLKEGPGRRVILKTKKFRL